MRIRKVNPNLEWDKKDVTRALGQDEWNKLDESD
jgi:hypothetical protein